MIRISPIAPTILPQNPITLSSAGDGLTLSPRYTTSPSFPHFSKHLSSRSNAACVSDHIPDRDSYQWATLIRESSRDGRSHEALVLFREMVRDHHKPNEFSLSVVLGCCASLRAVKAGREVHGFMVRNTCDEVNTCCSESSLVDFYAKCGFLSRAREVFDRMRDIDVVSWTILLMTYANSDGCGDEVMGLFQEMLCGGVVPNQHTLTAVLRRVALQQGEQLHAYIVKRGWDSDAFIGSTLVDMYAKNGVLGVARLVFDGIECKDVVCFNSLISGFGRLGIGEGLVSMFKEMGLVGLVGNQSTYVGLLNGCANFGFIGLSKQFHAHVIVRGFASNEVVQGVVVDMYAKCGNLEAARAAFDRIGAKKNIVAWNSMIGGYGKHGYAEEALCIFHQMELTSIHPDYITFTCLLSSCSHSGLVDEGWGLFNLMGMYGIPAQNEHYCCMVDLLGRAGMVQEAYDLIRRRKCESGASVWGALLSACRVWGDAEIGEVAARRLFELEPESSGSYVTLASIFAASGRWDEAVAVRELMDGRGVRKDPGYSWIEIGGVVYKFKAGEAKDHPGMEEVHTLCNRLNSCICEPPHLDILIGCDDYYLQE